MNTKTRLQAMFVGIAVTVAASGVSQAMSELVDLQIDPDWPTNSAPGTIVRYKVIATRLGQGVLDVKLGSQNLPEGATFSFSPEVLRFTGRAPEVLTCVMTINCANVGPTDGHFLITGDARREGKSVEVVLNYNGVPAEPPALSPPTLAIDRLSTGEVRLRGTGMSGASYDFEATASLTNPSWGTIGTSTADGNGRFTFIETPSQSPSMRFYRAVERPSEASGTQP